MSAQSFRFLHASDLHLEQPLGGLAEVPAHLRDLFVEAPFTAAERVFDAAVRERVDFVVFSGDIIDPSLAGPRGISFLVNQFQRLEAHGIAVYWAGGKCDGPQEWPNAARLPDSVTVFPSFKTEEVSHFRGERALASIVGRSWHGKDAIEASDYAVDGGNLFTIAVGYGECDRQKTVRGIDYWAVGGRHQRLLDDMSSVHFPGSPQGRSPHEMGPHGCTLVHVSDQRAVRTQFVATDAMRWQRESLTVESGETRIDVKRRMAERMKQLLIDAVERPILLNWNITGSDRLGTAAKCREWQAEILEWLRAEFGQGKAAVWTLDVEIEENHVIPDAWYAEESMLGDFLRVIRSQDSADAIGLDLTPYIPERLRTSALAVIADWTSSHSRRGLLGDAAILGSRLLGVEERV